jgi:hypothetical protein
MMLEEYLEDDVLQFQNPDQYSALYAVNGRFFEYPMTHGEI